MNTVAKYVLIIVVMLVTVTTATVQSVTVQSATITFEGQKSNRTGKSNGEIMILSLNLPDSLSFSATKGNTRGIKSYSAL